jgi:predicted transcriptional regulator
MEGNRKKPITLYLDQEVYEMLESYARLSHRNKTRIMNEGIQEYLISHLQSEITKGGINIEQ